MSKLAMLSKNTKSLEDIISDKDLKQNQFFSNSFQVNNISNSLLYWYMFEFGK